VAKACGRTPCAIYKWINAGCQMRTDYTGETGYASKIAAASGGQFTENQILEISKPVAANGGHNQLHQRKYRKWKP
jgi:hypothetical protein